jgi:hypothetical protein
MAESGLQALGRGWQWRMPEGDRPGCSAAKPGETGMRPQALPLPARPPVVPGHQSSGWFSWHAGDEKTSLPIMAAGRLLDSRRPAFSMGKAQGSVRCPPGALSIGC